MKKQTKYAAAVVGGAGDWGRHYLRAYHINRDCRLIAVVDKARERRKVFADRYQIPEQFDTVHDLLQSMVPDIVSIILPVSQTYKAVMRCAEAGVGVISCEKPISENLAKADEMVLRCRDRGIPFSCGTALWEVAHLREIGQWAQAGNIGRFTEAAIPMGVTQQVSGIGCVVFNLLRFLTGCEAQWVEGWTIPEEAADNDGDCGVYGRIGFSGGFVCTVPSPGEIAPEAAQVSLSGSEGRIWLGRPHPVLVKGKGALAGPVYPEFFTDFAGKVFPAFFDEVVKDLVVCRSVGKEASCGGHDYRQALEIAIAFKLSARSGHGRVQLPLEERDINLYPIPYRWLGGDVTGWEVIGVKGPPAPVD